MYSGLVHAHSGLRWLVLVFLLLAIATAWQNWSRKVDYPQGRWALLALIFTHLQLLLGLALYIWNAAAIKSKVQFGDMGAAMSNSIVRFYTVEHISLMLVAIAVITIGYSRAKKMSPAAEGHKALFTFYLIGLILILVSIPWPFRALGAGWF
ncbi:MAG: cytochrome B [Lewinella sp.]|nr:cytochrome B [Lewinella sp.]